MGAIMDWLDGKKTIIAGAAVGIFGALSAAGVHLPFSVPTTGTITAVLGALVVIGRMFASKPGILAAPAPPGAPKAA